MAVGTRRAAVTTGNDAAGDLAGAVLALLARAPAGLSDTELCAALTPDHPGLRAQKVNQICRRLAGWGSLERVGVRPIRNRVTDASAAPVDPAPVEAARGSSAMASAAPDDARAAAPEPAAEPEPAAAAPTLAARLHQVRARSAPSFARRHSGGTRPTTPVAPSRPEAGPPGSPAVPRRDPTLGWTRTANVTAAVVAWLQRRGATLRRIDAAGPAHDLVVALDGADVHVEVTGWPPDGGRTHPATVAGEWFTAAADAATARRRAHPRARIVVAVPETRRYRTLSERQAATLTAARAEVWFVAPDGSMRLD